MPFLVNTHMTESASVGASFSFSSSPVSTEADSVMRLNAFLINLKSSSSKDSATFSIESWKKLHRI